MEDLNNLIDATTFGTVRRYLKAAHSPITTVMLVQHRNTLAQAGTALIDDEGSSRVFRRRQWAEWFNTGEVRVGGASSVVAQTADVDAIPDSAICDVLYVPPVYLVCLRGCKAPAVRPSDA
ncbi:MAG: hypothetical protein AB9869_24975 [Verrucomicrobiia bacterium]